MAEPVVEFVNVSKTFGGLRAVRSVSFRVERGEFFSLLGPSGCGKTTTLRLIAGFEQPDEDGGQVRLHGEVVNRKRPYERRLGMVFQSYALFPHLSVERNIAFGLEMRGTPRREIPRRVGAAMEQVRLDASRFRARMPAQLSGGQRQRVALARALVLEPEVLLLDEPLGALDLKLRKEMQLELKTLHRELGTTFVYVTHDQEEALTMSDRIAVLSEARIAQIGTPAEIYEDPRTEFVARYIGESNLFAGTARGRRGRGWEVAGASGWSFEVPHHERLGPGREVTVAVRPERLALVAPGEVREGENAVEGRVRDVIYLGEALHVLVALPGDQEVKVALRNEGQLARPVPWKRGDPAVVAWKPEDGRVLEAEPRGD